MTSFAERQADVQRRAGALRSAALNAGMVPIAIEGPISDLAGMGGNLWGLRLNIAERLAVLALPNRKIGRYECVPPTRFVEGDQ